MARIQVDFDQVMYFGDLVRDLGQALDSYRSVFAQDPARLDRIIDEFLLTRSTSNSHFSGQTVAWSFENASSRAHRVASSMNKTSSRIFRHANTVVDDHFSWGSVLTSPFMKPISAALEFGGGKIIEFTAGLGAKGALATPYLIAVGPAFLLVTGGLAIYEGAVQIYEAAGDAWEYTAGGLKLVAGGIGTTVGIVGVSMLLVGPATAAAFFATPVVLGILAVGAVAGTVALIIDHREAIGSLIGFDQTETETVRDQLAGATGTWTIPLGATHGPTVVAEFDSADVGGLTVDASSYNTVLQGSTAVALQGAAPRMQPRTFTSASTDSPSPNAAPFTMALSEPEEALRSRFSAANQHHRYGNGTSYDVYGMQHNAAGNCTSYVAWRLNDLARDQDLNWSMDNSRVGAAAGTLGNGGSWGEGAAKMGFPPDSTATPGSVAWWGPTDKNPDGHVGVVRSVDADSGMITVEESVWDDEVLRIKTYHPGDSRYPSGFLHLLPGS